MSQETEQDLQNRYDSQLQLISDAKACAAKDAETIKSAQVMCAKISQVLKGLREI